MEMWSLDEMLRRGLCAERGDHAPHLHQSATLGRFWCTADQEDREPYRSERRRGDIKSGPPGAAIDSVD